MSELDVADDQTPDAITDEHEVIADDDAENVHEEKNDSPQPDIQDTAASLPLHLADLSLDSSSSVGAPDTPDAAGPMPLHLADLPLHSPSSVIVGTPFSDIHSTRFEYPFPDSASPEIPANGSPPHNSPTFSSPSSSVLLSTSSQPQLILNPPPALHHYPASFPPPAELTNYSPTHPKMRAVSPPVPPALVKRRQRWTLGLGSLGRKLSMRSGNAAAGSSSPDADPSHRRALGDDKAIAEASSTATPDA
ncbi:hypothetical protein FB45DRAFT_1031221 [Roridomyces roridus]|uniref:Uncharacterized protein n=1 Tax=Roridomyces roridus TaxID=1738132 RepID=A0AAD7BK62_9AGAR|nr:hypothetical protein FB45DRAFT_1031221 [Roridomyces roridus]